MTPNDFCPLCSEGNLQHKISKNPVEYKGQSDELDFHFSVCDSCGSEQSNAVQLRANKRTMLKFKKAHHVS